MDICLILSYDMKMEVDLTVHTYTCDWWPCDLDVSLHLTCAVITSINVGAFIL